MSALTISSCLNDDCLLHICSYLNLNDLISVSRVSLTFNRIVKILYRRFKRFEFSLIHSKNNNYKEIEFDEVEKIISEIGEYIFELNIQAVKFKAPNRELLEFILKGCQKNLQKLQIEGFVLKKKFFQNVFPIFSQLKSLELRNCAISNYFNEILQKAEDLSELNFYRNYKFHGQCLMYVKNIEILSLNSCKNIESKYFKYFCENNRNLKILNIQKCEWITQDNLWDLVKNLVHLEKLTISNSSPNLNEFDLKILGDLSHLKDLEIDFINFTTVDPLLLQITKNKRIETLDISSGPTTNITISIISNLDKLKILKLNDKLDLSDENLLTFGERCPIMELHITGCCSITNEGLIAFIKQTRKTIRFLDLSACYGVTDYLITSSFEFLGSRCDEILFVVGGTQIDEDFNFSDFKPIRLSFKNNYETSMNVDYHICDNPSDEKRFNRLMRLGLVIDDKLFSSDDSDVEEF